MDGWKDIDCQTATLFMIYNINIKVGPTGEMRFIPGIKIAHLALKHR